MARMHIQVDAPKYENMLPAHCRVNVNGVISTAILWESYIDPREFQPVYLSTMEGRYLMIQEADVEEATVERIYVKGGNKCQTKVS